MFELSVAKKYLMPSWKQLSVSIISLISILVIALVVWLIVVFFSVTNGLERGWVQKLISLTAPVRVTPTAKYYESHYYLVDSLSGNSNYTTKSIGEKLRASNTDPYDSSMDQEPSPFFPTPLLGRDGSMKDLVKEAYSAIESVANELDDALKISDYEVTTSHLRLQLLRNFGPLATTKEISQATYLGSYTSENRALDKTLLQFSIADVQNLDQMLKLAPKENFFSSDGIFLPKTFKDIGVLVGDKGTISYYTPTLSSVQEQQIPIHVVGFYDPGLIPLGGKFILASKELVSLVRSSQETEASQNSNGINVHFDKIEKADLVKSKIQKALAKAELTPFFKVETYKEYDFTKDILQQLQSDKTLFTLISTIIIIVACSNIISMLIIMVNDKKMEIGILRSMGTSSMSIASIFGMCGVIMGVMGSTIGMIAAYFTLKNLNFLIAILSEIQGHNAFNPIFYGDTLPSEISMEALFFVILSTACISLIAGIVPAVKASLLRPSTILRSE